MITYEYLCNECSHQFETEQSIKDRPLTTCTECGKESLERVIYGGVYASVDPGITTVGKQAEVNTKKMGGQVDEERAKEREAQAKTEVTRPWGKPTKDLQEMLRHPNSKKLIHRYIMEGR